MSIKVNILQAEKRNLILRWMIHIIGIYIIGAKN